MLETLFILQYSLLNGWILQQQLMNADYHWLQKIGAALIISWCFNSLLIYTMIKIFALPFQVQTIASISLGSSAILLLASKLWHSTQPS